MLASSVVTRAENQCLNTVGAGCNFFDSHQTLDFFDEAFDANALSQPQLALKLLKKQVHKLDIA